MCIARTSDKDILNLQICDYLFIKRLSEPDKIDYMQLITRILFSNRTYDLYTIEISLQFLKENISL